MVFPEEIWICLHKKVGNTYRKEAAQLDVIGLVPPLC